MVLNHSKVIIVSDEPLRMIAFTSPRSSTRAIAVGDHEGDRQSIKWIIIRELARGFSTAAAVPAGFANALVVIRQLGSKLNSASDPAELV